MSKDRKGFSTPIFILILAILIVVASSASYYILRNAGKMPTSLSGLPYTSSPTTTVTISNSDKAEDIEKELEGTTEGDPEADIGELNSSASSL